MVTPVQHALFSLSSTHTTIWQGKPWYAQHSPDQPLLYEFKTTSHT